MNEDIIKMINIYQTNDVDWMGDKITSLSDLTRHHIVKKQYDGIDDISNYALLTSYSHHFIHFLENHYNKEYNYLNDMFIELNNSKKPPNEEYFNNIMSVLKRVRKDIKNKKRKKRN